MLLLLLPPLLLILLPGTTRVLSSAIYTTTTTTIINAVLNAIPLKLLLLTVCDSVQHTPSDEFCMYADLSTTGRI